MTVELALVVLREGPFFVVQGVNRDIAAQGHTMGEALGAFRDVLETHIALDTQEGLEPLSRLPPCPRFKR